MAMYKVPQDVEADDKLIGPFSFRQFIYLIVVALAIAAAWGLAQLFIGLAVIPLPIVLLFGALALPLRKDQPMEIYLAAMVSFYLKPRRRLWDPDGVDSLIEITVPKTVEVHLTKGLTQEDAEQRISYLANLVDSQGWAIRGAAAPTNTPVNNDVFLEAQDATDVLDTNTAVSQSFDALMDKRTAQVRDEAIERMHQPAAPIATPTPFPTQPTQISLPPAVPVVTDGFSAPSSTPPTVPIYNPYPNFQQTVIQPMGDTAHLYTDPTATAITQPPVPAPTQPPRPQTEPTTTSDKPVSAGIMNLANNTDLSIETIAHEAHRIQEKEDDLNEEVVISLR